jgi:hypothetical protein
MLMHPSKTWRPRAKYTLMQNGTYYYDKLRLVPTSWRLRPVSSKSSQRKTYIFKMLIVPPNKQSFSSTSVCNRCITLIQINDSTETFRFGMVFVPKFQREVTTFWSDQVKYWKECWLLLLINWRANVASYFIFLPKFNIWYFGLWFLKNRSNSMIETRDILY